MYDLTRWRDVKATPDPAIEVAAATVGSVFELREVPYDHPDAVVLTALAQNYYVEIYGSPDDDPLGAANLRSPRGGFVVGYLNGDPVAMGGWLFTGPEPRTTVQIRRMFVDPRARRQRLAAAILQRLESDAIDHGGRYAQLSTGRPQVEAIAFYRTHGYQDIPAFGYYADADDVVCLGKPLSRADG